MREARKTILTSFARDLCTRTEAEIRANWQPRHIEALEKIHPGAFEGRLKNHNPIYYVATHVFFDNKPDLLYPPLHRDRICKEILDYLVRDTTATMDQSGLLVLVQRDSFKSTFMHGVVPLFFSLREKYVHNRDVRILLCHQREEQASSNLRRMKSRIIQSAFMHRYWSDDAYKFTSNEDFGTTLRFDWPCKAQGIFHESSVTAAGVGAKLVGMHFDLICNDDLVNEEQVHSKTIRDQIKFRYAASRFLLDTMRGKEINSGTPYHINDLWNQLRLAKKNDGSPLYRSLVIGAGGKHTDQPLSFPNRHTQAFLDKKIEEIKQREGTDILYWLQYQCEPRSTGLIATDLKWIKEISFEEIPKNIPIVIVVDPAWKGTTNQGTGCDAALAVIGFEKRGFVTLTYLIDLIVSNEMTSLDGMNAIFELMTQYMTTEVAVEEHNSHSFRVDLSNEAQTRGKWIHLVDLKTKFRQKNERIVAFLRRVQAGQFFLVSNCRNKDIFLSQYEDFPQVDKNDALDAVSYSADPNIAELFAPRFNTEAQGYEWFPYEEPKRTRHCMT